MRKAVPVRLERNTGGIRIGKTLYMVQGVELQVAEGVQPPADRAYILPGVRNATIRGAGVYLPHGDGFPGIAAGYLPAPVPLHGHGGRVMGLAMPVDLLGTFNGQPLAWAEILPVNPDRLHPFDAPGIGLTAGGNVWIDPVSGVAVARATDEEMDPVNEAGDAISADPE